MEILLTRSIRTEQSSACNWNFVIAEGFMHCGALQTWEKLNCSYSDCKNFEIFLVISSLESFSMQPAKLLLVPDYWIEPPAQCFQSAHTIWDPCHQMSFRVLPLFCCLPHAHPQFLYLVRVDWSDSNVRPGLGTWAWRTWKKLPR